MADKKPKKRVLKKTETVRERAAKPKGAPKRRKLSGVASNAVSKASKPLGKIRNFGKKEYYLPMPDNKIGQFLNKRRSVIPKYFKDSWAEVRQVEWPSRKQTAQLTMAVFMFAFFFGLIVAVVDYGLGLAFEKFIVK